MRIDIEKVMEKIIHQIWVGPYEMPNREKDFVNLIKKTHPSFQHILWTDKDLPELPPNIKEAFDSFGKASDYAHQADILRVFLIAKYGGVYLDVDFKCINGFESTDYFQYDSLFCYHGGSDYTMPNGIFGSSKESNIINFLVQKINTRENNWYGPSWLGDSVKEYLGFPRETDHNDVLNEMNKINIKYLLFSELENKHFRHHALYSWSPENKRNFANGNINYLDGK